MNGGERSEEERERKQRQADSREKEEAEWTVGAAEITQMLEDN